MAFDTFWGRADLAKWRVESLSPEESKFLPSQRRLDFSSGRSNAAGRDLIDLAKSGDLHSLQVASCIRAPAVSQLLAVTVQLLVEVGANVNCTDELGYVSDALCPLSYALARGRSAWSQHAGLTSGLRHCSMRRYMVILSATPPAGPRSSARTMRAIMTYLLAAEQRLLSGALRSVLCSIVEYLVKKGARKGDAEYVPIGPAWLPEQNERHSDLRLKVHELCCRVPAFRITRICATILQAIQCKQQFSDKNKRL